MKRHLMAALLALCVSLPAMAGKCLTNDRWVGQDKAMHLAAGSLIGMAATLQTGRWQDGMMWGAGIGALKELTDAGGSGTCSLQDLLVTVLGAAIGSSLGNWAVTHTTRQTTVSYVSAF